MTLRCLHTQANIGQGQHTLTSPMSLVVERQICIDIPQPFRASVRSGLHCLVHLKKEDKYQVSNNNKFKL